MNNGYDATVKLPDMIREVLSEVIPSIVISSFLASGYSQDLLRNACKPTSSEGVSIALILIRLKDVMSREKVSGNEFTGYFPC